MTMGDMGKQLLGDCSLVFNDIYLLLGYEWL